MKNPGMFAGSVFGIVGGIILLFLAQRFESSATDTFISKELVEGALMFLGFIITGLSGLALIMSFFISKPTKS